MTARAGDALSHVRFRPYYASSEEPPRGDHRRHESVLLSAAGQQERRSFPPPMHGPMSYAQEWRIQAPVFSTFVLLARTLPSQMKTIFVGRFT